MVRGLCAPSNSDYIIQVGGGVLGDTWHPEERGRAIAIYSLAPLLGPVFGPVCGGWCVHT